MDRTVAARRVRERTKSRGLTEATLRRWESVGLLSSRGKGRCRVPATYSDVDVLRASAVATLRREGFTLAEVAVVLLAPRTRNGVG